MASILDRARSFFGKSKKPAGLAEEQKRIAERETQRAEEELKKQKLEELKTKIYRIDRAITEVLHTNRINFSSDLEQIKKAIVEINILIEANKEALATAAGMASSEDAVIQKENEASILKIIKSAIPNLREEARPLFNYAKFVSEEISKCSAAARLEEIHSAVRDMIFTWYGLNRDKLYRWWNSKS